MRFCTHHLVFQGWLLLIVCLMLCSAGYAQPAPLLRAHAHNDYEHERPLLDALDHGFTSIEADIHLVKGTLLVAHDLEDVQPERTLEALYLAPLRERVRVQGGRVHANGPSVILLIDIKSEAEATYRVLRELLRQYADMLTVFTPEASDEGAVTAIISGNRPRALMEAEAIRYAAYDGRLDDLTADTLAPPTFIPLISSNWAAITRWYGQGELPAEAQRRLEITVAQAHTQGRMLRFWATGDNPAVWQVLYDAGVDWLNADDLALLREFLLAAEAGR